MALLKAFPAASSALRKPLVSTALRSSFVFRPSFSAAKHTQFLTSNKFSTAAAAAAPVSRFSYSPGAGASEATPLSRSSSSSTSSSTASFQSSNSNAFPSSAAAIAAGAAPATRREADTGVGSQIPLATGPVEGTVPVSINGSTTSRPSVDFKGDWVLPHPLWNGEYVWNVDYTHYPPKDFVDQLAKWTIKTIRFNFDWMSGYSFGKLTPAKALLRVVFLETVAGVPGSVGGVLRHLASLRRMKRDGGWIHTLIEEAENERMHLLTFIKLRQPGPFLRLCVFLTQGVFFNFFWISYLISPRFCHRLVGYLEEEAVLTYTKMLHEIDNGSLSEWKDMPAPDIAKKYWALPENATIRDVVAHVRADEAHHRDVNHRFASLKSDELNPFAPGH